MRKTDRTDAETLARLARSDLALLRPVEHRSERHQVDLEMLKARDTLVAARTMLVNHVRGAVKSFGERLPASDTDTFAQNVVDDLPPGLCKPLLPLLAEIRLLTRGIRRYDARVKQLCEKEYPETELLRGVKGVGPVTSLAFILVLGQAKRFRRSRDVGSYLGLCPRIAQSGDANPQLRITKAGNGFMRRLLVQAAQYILGPFGEDCTLRRVGQRLMISGGRRGKKRAVIAVARKLAVMLHHMWATGEVYDALRDAAPLPIPAPAPTTA
jgi:transposase